MPQRRQCTQPGACSCDLGLQNVDYQEIRGTCEIIMVRIDQMSPKVQRIIDPGHNKLIYSTHGFDEFGVVRV
jgi:hypothetical protein